MKIDYGIYDLSITEKAKYYICFFAAAGAISVLFFNNIIIGFFCLPAIVIYKPIICRLLAEKRQQRIRTEFVDFLYSMSSSAVVGAGIAEALKDAQNELSEIYGEKSIICREIKDILLKTSTANESVRTLLKDFAERSGIWDIRSFVDLYYGCVESGGNLVTAVNKSAQIITDKITMENDIKVFISQKKFEGRIIAVMPLGIILFLRIFSPEYLMPLYYGKAGKIIMAVSLLVMIYAFSYSEKISKVAFASTIEGDLPEFINRISLLLSAGMVLPTILQKIAEEGEHSENVVFKNFYEIYQAAQRDRKPVLAAFQGFAGKSRSRELMRFARILESNVSKGTELSERLDTEAEILWHMAKKKVEEKGKLAETKMSLPTGMMMMVLIVITTAPALMTL